MSQEIKEIINTYENEVLHTMTASRRGIELIRSLNESEKTRLLEELYCRLEKTLRSLALKQLEDSIKFIKGTKDVKA